MSHKYYEMKAAIIAAISLLNLSSNSNYLCHGFSLLPFVSCENRNSCFRSSLHPRMVKCSGGSQLKHLNPNTALLQSSSDPNDEGLGKQDESLDGRQSLEKDVSNNIGSALGKIVEATSLFTSFLIQFLGVCFSLGLVLNLCGYGYTVDLERGVHIDKMDKIRTEIQFRRLK